MNSRVVIIDEDLLVQRLKLIRDRCLRATLSKGKFTAVIWSLEWSAGVIIAAEVFPGSILMLGPGLRQDSKVEHRLSE